MPKARITRQMIIDAAFEVTRTAGIEHVNARTVSEKLGCSTQPVMYHFARIEDMKKAVYEKADAFHTESLLHIENVQEGVLLGIGLNYIRFAVKEPHLFRFLFQSGFAAQNSILDMMDAPELEPIIAAMQNAMGMCRKQVKTIFLTIALFAHGYASIIANNALAFDETMAAAHLKRTYQGAVLAAQEEEA